MIRRKGAEGCLPVLPEEKIEILVVLSQDPDAATRNTARATLSAWDSTELIRVLSNPAVPLDVLEFAARELVPQRIELAMALLENPALPEPLREALEDPATFSAKATPAEGTADPAAGRSDSQPGLQRETLLQKIGRMTVAEKINAALMGSREE